MGKRNIAVGATFDKKELALLKYYLQAMDKMHLVYSHRLFMPIVPSLKSETIKKDFFSTYNHITDGMVEGL